MMMGKIEAARELRFGWAIVRTYAGQERLALDSLERAGFEVYLPMTLRENLRQKRTYGVPFMPNYLFAKLSPAGPGWWVIMSRRGVESLLGKRADNRPPLLLRDEAVQKFREREEGGYIKIAALQGKPTRPEFDKGQRLRVNGGLFDQLEVVFETYVDEKRAMLLASLIGNSDSRRKLFIDWRELTAA